MRDFVLVIGQLSDETPEDLCVASALVDIASESAEGPWTPTTCRIDLVAPLDACVELALPLLGRAEARTVEGGERRASPLRLHPYGVANSADGTIAVLRQLYLSGAFESDVSPGDFIDLPESLAEALSRFSRERDGPFVEVFLGSGDLIGLLPPRRGERISRLSAEELEQRIDELLPDQPEHPKELRESARRGTKTAVLLAHYIDRLESE